MSERVNDRVRRGVDDRKKERKNGGDAKEYQYSKVILMIELII